MRLSIHTSQGQVSTSGRAQLTPVEAKALPLKVRGQFQVARAAADSAGVVTLLDYGAGNVRSVRNAVKQLGYTLKEARFYASCWQHSVLKALRLKPN